ncbi:hypothetical protein J7E50_10875 [Pedobacter sp. ISL-68]|uniref:DUF6965 family protein n=1 Tax=unclassified Pedobacter TaxID=2628915 RepID=UPI001BE856A9|nr:MULTISPECIES: hypothetical protein [unclassified Pedobacter]MBT2561335.1 hypothetical protein [Pedobacter sp. ISL-64]MBT2590724.1 hypothetical protein [Pedobacter sp. ISL-68]
MQKDTPQHPEVLQEVARLKEYFDTTPILIKEWRQGCMVVKDIPEFIKLELNAAATFNPKHPFNPPLRRLQQLEQSIRNQLNAVPVV